MKLYLIRHGQTEDNLAKVTMGQQDSPLTEAGLTRAREVGEMLKDTHLDAVYSSDLARALDTARLINEIRAGGGLPIIPIPALREIAFGVFEKRPYDVIPARNQATMHVPVPGGESDEQMAVRVVDAVNTILQAHADQAVLIVTHFGPVAALLASIEGISLFRSLERRVENAGLIELEVVQPLEIPQLV